MCFLGDPTQQVITVLFATLGDKVENGRNRLRLPKVWMSKQPDICRAEQLVRRNAHKVGMLVTNEAGKHCNAHTVPHSAELIGNR